MYVYALKLKPIEYYYSLFTGILYQKNFEKVLNKVPNKLPIYQVLTSSEVSAVLSACITIYINIL